MRTKLIITFFASFFLAIVTAQESINFSAEAFTKQMYDKVNEDITSKIDEALKKGAGFVFNETYVTEMLRPYVSYGINPNGSHYYEELKNIYTQFKEDPNFSPGEMATTKISSMIESKISNEIKSAIGKENIEMATAVNGLFQDAKTKISGILKAAEQIAEIPPQDPEIESKVEQILRDWGLTGKFFQSVGDLEVVLTKGYDQIKEPMEMVTSIVTMCSETNPTTKIEKLFAFGESVGGKIPIVGSIVKAFSK